MEFRYLSEEIFWEAIIERVIHCIGFLGGYRSKSGRSVFNLN